MLPFVLVTRASAKRVLLLGPDDDARRALHLMLDRAGTQVVAMADLDAARAHLAANDCDAVIAAGGLAPQIVDGSRARVIALVQSRDLAEALALLSAGVDDVLTEPVDELAVTLALRHVAALPRRGGSAATPVTLVGDGPAMRALRAKIAQIAAHRTTVLITGESGTGKELVARALHAASPSPRRAGKFVAINCAAIPEALLESELFGHARGAFTDAVRDRVGLFEEASGGTLFLDEVGEIPLALQGKLLRALQEGEIRRVGETTSVPVDVRVIAATLRDLRTEIAEGRFREDLYYRLDVVPIEIPPLRERLEDVPQLVELFLARHAERHQRAPIELLPEVVQALATQPWPGNVRELENLLERLLVLADGPVVDLAFLTTVMNLRTAVSPTDTDELSIKKATRDLEARLISRALGVTQGNRTNAAKLLEISHRALLYKMKDYGIS